MRSRVRVTGDEPGDSVIITGEADQRLADDMTLRAGDGAYSAAQFERQSNPHGSSVFGTHLGRSAKSLSSRDRGLRDAPVESTEGGLAITGSVVGRSHRVTGDEGGACRQVTGDQYLSPCRDPATGAKGSSAETRAWQRITGWDVEPHRLVTGTSPGACAVLTGTPYQGASTLQAWCNPPVAATAEKNLPSRPSVVGVTGDVPVHSDNVTGTGRGAARAISGTAYFREASKPEHVESAVAALDARFSIRSPQRTAQLKADHAAISQPSAATGITGSFAIGVERVTGNLEFSFRPRRSDESNARRAHAELTGEGRTTGTAITGASWADQSNVTGTDSENSSQRNPSQRGSQRQPFAGARRFKEHANREEYKQLVTGMAGWSSDTAAKVTLSGGAQG